MNWLKLFHYDLRSGLMRWRYLIVPLLFLMPCFQNWIYISGAHSVGSWIDYMLGCFKGIPPLISMEEFEFPIQWFLVMGGCLFLSLDYPLNDLTEAGQQVIIRSVSKRSWFLSKCAWNLLSCVAYVLLGALTALVFALATGGSSSLANTPAICENTLQLHGAKVLTGGQALITAVGLPLLTLMALNMLQMVLCLLIRPVFSFLSCICLLVMSLFFDSPYALGNGAIVARSGILLEGAQDPVPTALFCVAVIGICVIIGIIRFDRMDHLRYEG